MSFLNFNPRAPYGARLTASTADSSRTPFQSTRPIRGATWVTLSGLSPGLHFNPRAPYGARLQTDGESYWKDKFQSTRPIRGATYAAETSKGSAVDFNPRAPYGARPYGGSSSIQIRQNFNPRAPYGARLMQVAGFNHFKKFQSTRPIRGATTPIIVSIIKPPKISIHAPHTGRDWVPSHKPVFLK